MGGERLLVDVLTVVLAVVVAGCGATVFAPHAARGLDHAATWWLRRRARTHPERLARGGRR